MTNDDLLALLRKIEGIASAAEDQARATHADMTDDQHDGRSAATLLAAGALRGIAATARGAILTMTNFLTWAEEDRQFPS